MLADRGEGRVRFVPVNLLSVIQAQHKDLYHGGHGVHRRKAHRGILAGCGYCYSLKSTTLCQIGTWGSEGDSMIEMLLRPPYIFLILGVIIFSGAVVSTCTGTTSARTGRWI